MNRIGTTHDPALSTATTATAQASSDSPRTSRTRVPPSPRAPRLQAAAPPQAPETAVRNRTDAADTALASSVPTIRRAHSTSSASAFASHPGGESLSPVSPRSPTREHVRHYRRRSADAEKSEVPPHDAAAEEHKKKLTARAVLLLKSEVQHGSPLAGIGPLLAAMKAQSFLLGSSATPLLYDYLYPRNDVNDHNPRPRPNIDVGIIRDFVAIGADINACVGDDTPLSAAIRHGDLHTVNCLIGAGASLQAPNRSGQVPLALAVAAGHPAVTAFLLAHAARN